MDRRLLTVVDDDDPNAWRVLAAAMALAPLLGAAVDTVHVTSGAVPTEVLLREARVPEVVAMVTHGRAPDDHVSGLVLDVLCRAARPVVVIPPRGAPPHGIQRVLIPLDGSGATTRAVAELMRDRAVERNELIVLHVFDDGDFPAYADQVVHEVEAWEREFLERYSPVAGEQVRLESRVGEVAKTVRAVAEELDVDLVVVAWHQDLTHSDAEVVTELLVHGDIPLVLLPLADAEQDDNHDDPAGG